MTFVYCFLLLFVIVAVGSTAVSSIAVGSISVGSTTVSSVATVVPTANSTKTITPPPDRSLHFFPWRVRIEPDGLFGNITLTPNQKITVLVDSQTEDTWVVDVAMGRRNTTNSSSSETLLHQSRCASSKKSSLRPICKLTYNTQLSNTYSTFDKSTNVFNSLDGSFAAGPIGQDNVALTSPEGHYVVVRQTFGVNVLNNNNINDNTTITTTLSGRLGIGKVDRYSQPRHFPNLLQTLKSRGIIHRLAFSWYPVISTRRTPRPVEGDILFGGWDSARFGDEVHFMDLKPHVLDPNWSPSRRWGFDHADEARSAVWSNLTANNPDHKRMLPRLVPTIIDTTSPLVYVPADQAADVWRVLSKDVKVGDAFGMGIDVAMVECRKRSEWTKDNTRIYFDLAGDFAASNRTRVEAKAADFVLPRQVMEETISGRAASHAATWKQPLRYRKARGFHNACVFGIQSIDMFDGTPGHTNQHSILGVPFLKNVYLLFDYEGPYLGVANSRLSRQGTPTPLTDREDVLATKFQGAGKSPGGVGEIKALIITLSVLGFLLLLALVVCLMRVCKSRAK